jgi:hypothetical protein
LGSLVTAFVPGANLASVGTGAVGSTARYYADKQRGTKNAGLNYLVNLGMDATMAIPILGGIGAISRIPKIVKNTLPTIVKAASVYGLGAGLVNTAEKIASGNFTVRDVDVLVNALTAGVGIKKSGGFGKSTKQVKSSKLEPVSIKSKDGKTTLALNESNMESIKNPDDLIEALFKEAKKTNSNLTKEQFSEQFNLDDAFDIAVK